MSIQPLASFIFVAVSALTVDAAQSTPLSVCQVLDSARDRKELVIRGIASGSVHGFVISEGIHYDPCPSWPAHLFTAPSAIGLEFVSSYGIQLTEQQRRLNRDFLARLHRLRVQGQVEQYPITLRGVLVRKLWPLIFRRADGTYHGFGMGPDGAYPAALIITSVLQEGN